MKKEIKKISHFEHLSETKDGYLVSGFSTAVGTQVGGSVAPALNIKCPVNTGNCAAGCGVKAGG
jgi:hypothetical protein